MNLPTNSRGALRLALVYAATGLLWILLSDTLLSRGTTHAELLTWQLLKGLAYVAGTSLLFFRLLTAYAKVVRDTEADRIQALTSADLHLKRYESQFEHSAIPTYVWQQKSDGGLALIDFNSAAVASTDGAIEQLRGVALTDMYPDSDPGVRHLIEQCITGRVTVREEMDYRYRTTDRYRHTRFTCAFVPPDLVTVQAEDVSEKEQALRALSDSEARYRSLFENSPDIIFTTGVDGRVGTLNPAFERLTGYHVADWIGRDIIELAAPEGAAESTSYLRKRRSGASDDRARDHIIMTASGERRYVQLRAANLTGPDGQVTGFSGFARDVTAQRAAERQLRVTEERFRAFMEAGPVSAWIKDSELRYVYINRTFEKVLNVEAATIIGKTDFDLVPDDVARLFRDMDLEVSASGKPVETVQILGAGLWKRALVLKFTMIVEGETFIGGLAIDVTEREVAKEEMDAQRSFLQAVIENVQDGIVACDEEGTVRLSNKAMREIEAAAGFPDAAAQKLTSRGSSEGSALSPLERALRGETFQDVPVPATSERIILASGQPVTGSDGRSLGAVTIMRDVTEKAEMQRRLEQSSRLAGLGRLAASIAHEFNNVLMGIQPFAELLEKNVDERSSLRRATKAIKDGVQRGRRVTHEVLRFTRPSELAIAPIPFHDWLSGVQGSLRSLLPADIALSVTLPNEPVQLAGDARQLEQVLVNLALNARDAMPRGGMLTIAAERSSGTQLELTISDTGSGIDAETLPHIFEPLFTTKRTGGTGLGLAISHQIVEQHGGRIEVESSPSGTTFRLFFPTIEPEPVAPVQVAKKSQSPKRRVLLVEDDDLVADGIAMLLEVEGHEVRVESRGSGAADLVKSFAPDVVILDVRLPDMDGPVVFEHIRKVAPRLPVIFSTGHADERQIANLLADPSVRYLLKPYDSTVLLELIATITAEPEG